MNFCAHFQKTHVGGLSWESYWGTRVLSCLSINCSDCCLKKKKKALLVHSYKQSETDWATQDQRKMLVILAPERDFSILTSIRSLGVRDYLHLIGENMEASLKEVHTANNGRGRAGDSVFWPSMPCSFLYTSCSQTWACISITWRVCFMQTAKPHPRISDSAGLGWSQKICFPKEFPGNADTLVQRPHTQWAAPKLPGPLANGSFQDGPCLLGNTLPSGICSGHSWVFGGNQYITLFSFVWSLEPIEKWGMGGRETFICFAIDKADWKTRFQICGHQRFPKELLLNWNSTIQNVGLSLAVKAHHIAESKLEWILSGDGM